MEADKNEISDSEEVDLDDIDVWKTGRSSKESQERLDTSVKEKEKNKIQNDFTYSSLIQKKFEILKKESAEVRARNQTRKIKIQGYRDRRKLKQEKKKTKLTKIELEDPNQSAWKKIKPYLTVNDHIAGPVSHGIYGPKTELEQEIDSSIVEGDFAKAEQLSDHLSNSRFAVKIAHAFAAKRYAEEKAQNEADRKARKKTKLYWGFEAKQRWQMKGNM